MSVAETDLSSPDKCAIVALDAMKEGATHDDSRAARHDAIRKTLASAGYNALAGDAVLIAVIDGLNCEALLVGASVGIGRFSHNLSTAGFLIGQITPQGPRH